jgi:hypothetical protein
VLQRIIVAVAILLAVVIIVMAIALALDGSRASDIKASPPPPTTTEAPHFDMETVHTLWLEFIQFNRSRSDASMVDLGCRDMHVHTAHCYVSTDGVSYMFVLACTYPFTLNKCGVISGGRRV